MSKYPEMIYLIDEGDEISWCNVASPTGYEEAGDSVPYTRDRIIKKHHLEQLVREEFKGLPDVFTYADLKARLRSMDK